MALQPSMIHRVQLALRFSMPASAGPLIGGEAPGATSFNGTSTAGHATITNDGPGFYLANGGSTTFNDSSTADSAILVANLGYPHSGGAAIVFNGASTGGTARVEVFGNGYLDISGHQSGLTIGSIEGSGNVSLGANNLRVGTNGINTSFSGVISGSGSLAKVGSGVLTLQANHCIADTVGLHSRKRLNCQTRLYRASGRNRLSKGQRRSATAGRIWRSNERRPKYLP